MHDDAAAANLCIFALFCIAQKMRIHKQDFFFVPYYELCSICAETKFSGPSKKLELQVADSVCSRFYERVGRAQLKTNLEHGA